jgi:hypothetical protein
MPSMEKVKLLMPHETSEGEYAYNELTKLYRNLAAEASGAVANPDDLATFMSSEVGRKGRAKSAYFRFVQDLQKQHAIFGKGTVGLFRGQSQRPFGSQYLQIASSAVTSPENLSEFYAKKDPFSVGVSQELADKLLRDMEEHGIDPREIKRLKGRLASGESIGAMAFRHPLIGQYSALPVNVNVVKGMRGVETAIIPEFAIKSEGILKGLNFSSLVGMAADKDGDNVALMFLEGGLEKKARNFFTDSENAQAILDHTARMQFIKPKSQAAADELASLTMGELSRTAAEKLGMTQEYVPKLSLSLSNIKESVARMPSSKLQAQTYSFLEMFEQIPISGKHKSAQELISDPKGFLSTFKMITDSLESGNAQGIKYSFEQALGKSALGNETVQKLLGDGIEISQANMEELSQMLGGAKLSRNVSGLNLEKVSQYISETVRSRATSSSLRDYQLTTGRAVIQPNEVSRYAKATELGGKAMKTAGYGENMAKAMLAKENLLAANGKKILRALKPLGIGAAIFAGANVLLSSSADATPSISTPNPKFSPGYTPGHQMSPQQMGGVPGVINDSPSAPTSVGAPTASIAPNGGYSVNGTINGDIPDVAGLAARLQSATGSNQNSSFTVNDNRGNINIHSLMNDLF